MFCFLPPVQVYSVWEFSSTTGLKRSWLLKFLPQFLGITLLRHHEIRVDYQIINLVSRPRFYSLIQPSFKGKTCPFLEVVWSGFPSLFSSSPLVHLATSRAEGHRRPPYLAADWHCLRGQILRANTSSTECFGGILGTCAGPQAWVTPLLQLARAHFRPQGSPWCKPLALSSTPFGAKMGFKWLQSGSLSLLGQDLQETVLHSLSMNPDQWEEHSYFSNTAFHSLCPATSAICFLRGESSTNPWQPPASRNTNQALCL